MTANENTGRILPGPVIPNRKKSPQMSEMKGLTQLLEGTLLIL